MTNWHTSSYSSGANECVEVAEAVETVKVRDTRNRDHGHLTFPHEQWTALLTTLKTD